MLKSITPLAKDGSPQRSDRRPVTVVDATNCGRNSTARLIDSTIDTHCAVWRCRLLLDRPAVWSCPLSAIAQTPPHSSPHNANIARLNPDKAARYAHNPCDYFD